MLQYIISNWMDVLGTALGLLYLYLEMKENIWMWVVGCIMPVIYVFVLYDKGIYADCGMEVYYFLAGIYGFVYWLRGKSRKGTPVAISHTPTHLKAMLWVYALVLWMVLGTALDRLTDSTVPYTDGLSTALSIIALWMLSRKYIEQWWVWLVVDLISTCLYIYKGIYGRALLYGIYTAMAVYGYYVWRRRMTLQTGDIMPKAQ